MLFLIEKKRASALPIFGAWVAPFVMSAVNTRIVQRSNALSKQSYGADFRYDEAMLAGKGLGGRATALSITAGLAGFMVASALPPTRWALSSRTPARSTRSICRTRSPN